MKKDIFNITVPLNSHGYRIDKFLQSQINELSRTRLQALIRDGQVKLNNIIITIIYFLIQKKDEVTLRNFSIGLFFFLIIVAPMLIQRADQYDDPFYFAYTGKVFSGTYEKLTSIQVKESPVTATEYIESQGILSFLDSAMMSFTSLKLSLMISDVFEYEKYISFFKMSVLISRALPFLDIKYFKFLGNSDNASI